VGVVLGLLALAVFVASCGSSGSSSEESGKLKIGINDALSGVGAFYGLPQLKTWEVLADEYNAEGGIEVGGKKYEIEVIAEDDKWDPATIRQVATNQVLNEKVNAVVAAGDPMDPIIAPITERNETLFLDWTANAEFVAPPNKLIINTLQTPLTTAPPFFEKIVEENPEVKSVYGVGLDIQYDKNNLKWSQEAAEKQGIEWKGSTFYPESAQDFSSYLGRAVNTNPDMIVFGSPSSAAPALLKTLKSLGYEGVVGSPATPEDLEADIKGAGSAANGFYQVEVHSWPLTPQLEAFKKAYTKKAGDWNALAPAHWIGAQFLLKAYQNAGTIDDPQKVMEAAETTSIPDPMVPGSPEIKLGGKETFGQVRALALPVALNQAVDEKPVTKAVLEVPVP
jgi:branched-chain amino acid transport system substrate-binding protein